MRPRLLRAAGFGLVAGVTLAGCTAGDADRPSGPVTITVTPRTALMDVPVRTTVAGLRPGSTVTLTAEATDRKGIRWSSGAVFVAAGDGTVSSAQAPARGSWSGAHPMGLLTTMTPQRPTEDTFYIPAGVTFQVTLRTSQNGRQVATTKLVRQTTAATGVQRRPLSPQSGLHGTLFLPADTSRRRPAVLAFGGSEGGEGADFTAGMLAAYGYPVLSLAYFHASGVPADLERIPLEYFARAAALLARQPGVDPRHVLAWGVSRGGEAALLVGVHYPKLISGVIATSTSDHASGGLPDQTAPAWTLHGAPLPFAGPADFDAPGAPGTPASVISVERIAGPVFTVCGVEDLLIPSCPFAAAIARRRGARGSRLGDIHLAYPHSGHFVGSLDPYDSTTALAGRTAAGVLLQSGGTIADNAEDEGTARARLLPFLAALP